MTNGLAAQLFEHEIAVIAMEPGFVRTEFVDLMSERGAWSADAAIPMTFGPGRCAALAGKVPA